MLGIENFRYFGDIAVVVIWALLAQGSVRLVGLYCFRVGLCCFRVGLIVLIVGLIVLIFGLIVLFVDCIVNDLRGIVCYRMGYCF